MLETKISQLGLAQLLGTFGSLPKNSKGWPVLPTSPLHVVSSVGLMKSQLSDPWVKGSLNWEITMFQKQDSITTLVVALRLSEIPQADKAIFWEMNSSL